MREFFDNKSKIRSCSSSCVTQCIEKKVITVVYRNIGITGVGVCEIPSENVH